MLAPAIIWIFTFARRSFSFVILLLVILFNSYSFIWNGAMDGYLALYFSIATLLLGRYLSSSHSIDLISSMWCLIILFYIKNEGTLAALIGFCLIDLFFILKNKPHL